MRLLIDTHILLWADQRPRQIASTLRTAMRDETNEIVVSAVTVWEIAIKRAIGKLRFDRPIVAAVLALGFEILPVSGAHAEHAGGLPPHHSDPFDRLILPRPIWRGWSSARRIGACCPTGSRRSASADQWAIWRIYGTCPGRPKRGQG